MAKAMMVVGFLVIFGTAGSSDLELISAVQETTRLIAGVLLMVVGFIKGRVWEYGENRNNSR